MKLKNLKYSTLVGVVAVTFTTHVLASSIPAWVLNPNTEGGIAAVDCVEFSGNLSVDAKLASSNARLALSKQISTQIDGVDETYDSREVAGNQSNIQSRFSSVSKQVTKQSISGSKILKSDIVEIQGKNYFCSMAVLSEDNTQRLFDNMVAKSNVQLSSEQKEVLYQSFQNQPSPDESQQIENLIDES